MEAAGLSWLAEAEGIRVPEVREVGGDPGFIVLERIETGRLSESGRRGARPRARRDARLGRGARSAPFLPARPTHACASGSRRSSWPSRTPGPRFYAGADARAAGGRARQTPVTSRPRTPDAVESVCERIDSLCGPARAARPPSRRPLVGQRPRRTRTASLADRPRGLRRPSRGRPRDAPALRLAERADLRGVRRSGAAGRWPRGARRALAAHRRSSSTRSSSAAPTERRRDGRPAVPLTPGAFVPQYPV